MFKKVLLTSVVAVFALSLNGCATASKQKDLDIQSLKNQVSLLESQVQSKDQEISSLRDELAKASEMKSGGNAGIVTRGQGNVKKIQTALKNAGFDPGKVDGKMGKQTRDAIKAFQAAHNLKVNGKVNKSTWAALSKYLEEKTK
jgi:N-acetyl-anhydromuramyl-L-alanine amidase AmpD